MKKEDKIVIIEKIANEIKGHDFFYLADINSLNAENTSKLRRACFKSNVKLMVVKNTLLKRALDSVEGDFEPIYESLKGNTVLMLTDVVNAPAKVIKEFTKKTKLEVPALKAAYIEESFYIGAEHLDTLSTMKSKNELIADVVALLQSPAKNVISSLQSGANTLHGLLKAIAEK